MYLAVNYFIVTENHSQSSLSDIEIIRSTGALMLSIFQARLFTAIIYPLYEMSISSGFVGLTVRMIALVLGACVAVATVRLIAGIVDIILPLFSPYCR